MSSNLKIASFDSATLSYKIISDSSIGAAPIVDVTSGSGKIYDINVDTSSGINNDYFLKLWLTTASVSIGTTPPDVIIKIPQDKVIRTNYPGGLPYTSLSAALVSGAEDSNTTHTTSGNSGTVNLTIVTS